MIMQSLNGVDKINHWSFINRNHEPYNIFKSPNIINYNQTLKKETYAGSWNQKKSSYCYFDTLVFRRNTAIMKNESLCDKAN